MAGPTASAVRVEGDWVSSAGLELSFVQVREERLPVALGVAGGGVTYIGRAGGRFWLEGEVALSSKVPLGLSIGPTVEVDRVRPWRFGAEGTLWIFAGIVPYVRVGAVQDTGGFFEVGAMIKIPVRRL